jgi:CheY-like chemotaxis protein
MDRRHSRNPPTGPLVLVVEGHERTLYADALPAMGFEVVAADGGNEALLHDLKQNPRTRDIRLVAVTEPDELASDRRQLPSGKAHVTR